MQCAYCGNALAKSVGEINRAAKAGLKLYCNRVCSGLGRRISKMPEERKKEKSAYDARRREEKREEIAAKKREYHQRTYDPIAAAKVRKAKMPQHIEYCRRPEYKAYKSDYDKKRKFARYGQFAECAMLLDELENEINSRATRYEIYIANGRYTRSATQRRRELWQQIHRN